MSLARFTQLASLRALRHHHFPGQTEANRNAQTRCLAAWTASSQEQKASYSHTTMVTSNSNGHALTDGNAPQDAHSRSTPKVPKISSLTSVLLY